MKKLLILSLCIVGSVAILSGCGAGSTPADDVNAKIKSMPAQDRFNLIKSQTALSIPQKDVAIDALPVNDDQKKKWKEEIRKG